MEKLLVFADFDWLKSIKLVGQIRKEHIRGSDSYCFEYDKDWLKEYGNIFFCEDLRNFIGPQYTFDKDLFSCFQDALPDYWGRTLLNRREQILVREEKRAIRRLSSFDYLLGIDDFSRMGGFRFKKNFDENFINSDKFPIPPLTDISQLELACQNVEKNEELNLLPEKKWLTQLVNSGSSLGGARPKASLIDKNGVLYMAKFPSIKDDYDVGLWEHFMSLLAKRAGVNVAQTSVIKTNHKYHTLLSKRFDRNAFGKRIHFSSAMALLGLKDGDGASTNHGYLNIVEFILQHAINVDENLKQLYRRVAFNISTGNTDDHFRNHGFFLTPLGWILSPAYDLNPTFNKYQSLLISSNSNSSDLDTLLDASQEYMISKEEAEKIILEVRHAISDWEKIALSLGISRKEIESFKPIFDKT